MSKKETQAAGEELLPEETKSKRPIQCGFCGKFEAEVLAMIAGPQTFICNECSVLTIDIMMDKMTSENTKAWCAEQINSMPYFTRHQPNDKLAALEAENKRLREALHLMDGPEPFEDRVFTDHGHYCSVVQPSMWRERKDKSTYPIRYTRTHIIFHKSAMSERRGMQIRRFHRAADSKDWHLATNPCASVDLTPEEWKIVMSKELSTGKRDV